MKGEEMKGEEVYDKHLFPASPFHLFFIPLYPFSFGVFARAKRQMALRLSA